MIKLPKYLPEIDNKTTITVWFNKISDIRYYFQYKKQGKQFWKVQWLGKYDVWCMY